MVNSWLQRFIDKSNYNTVGYSEDDEQATIFVKRKLPMEDLEFKVQSRTQPWWSKKDIVPEKIRTGILSKKPTQVVEVGEVEAQVADRREYEPFRFGCEIQPMEAGHVGTAGMLVQVPVWKDKVLVGWLKSFARLLERMNITITYEPAILTNRHVASVDVRYPDVGRWINQPYKGRNIGEVLHSLPLGPYDASIISLDQDYEPEIISIGRVKGVRDPVVGENVKKYGRTTRQTSGRVKHLNASITVNYGVGGQVRMNDCIILTKMSDSGDSGSAIIADKDNKAIGLLFAGSDKVTIAHPVKPALKQLGVEQW